MTELTIGGKTVSVRFEMLDWYLAGKELGIEFLPWGDTEFWNTPEDAPLSAAIESDLTLIYVALRKHFPGLTLESLAVMLDTTETWYEAQEKTREALADFFRRAANRAAQRATAVENEAQTPGPISTQ